MEKLKVTEGLLFIQTAVFVRLFDLLGIVWDTATRIRIILQAGRFPKIIITKFEGDRDRSFSSSETYEEIYVIQEKKDKGKTDKLIMELNTKFLEMFGFTEDQLVKSLIVDFKVGEMPTQTAVCYLSSPSKQSFEDVEKELEKLQVVKRE